MTAIGEKIETLVRTYHGRDEFDGVVLAARNGAVLYQGAAGWADRGRKTPHTLAAPFPICSITKQFTALLVMQQVAAGRLRLDSTVSETLPDFPNRDAGARVTLKQLLTHTSGLPNTDDIPDFYTNPDPRLTDPDFVIKTYGNRPTVAAPGAEFHYNNFDFLALAAILRKVTGTPYAALLTERILKPLQMTRTGLFDSKSKPSPIREYERKGTVFAEVSPRFRLANFGAAGAMYATVGDMLRWDTALQIDRLLPRAARDIMFTSDPSKGYVALGSWVYGYQKFGAATPVLVERQGGIGAFHAQNLLAPRDGISVVLLSNLGAADLAAYTGKGLTCDILRAIYEAG